MKYNPSFHIVDTEEQAKAFCERMNNQSTYYMRKHHPAHYTPWSNASRTEVGFVCWYWY